MTITSTCCSSGGLDPPHRYRLPWGRAARRDIPVVPVGGDPSPRPEAGPSKTSSCNTRDVFSEVPGRTTVAQHDIKTAPGVTVRVPPLPGPGRL